MDTLVLTNGYEPYDRICWKRAITMVLNGVAEALEWYDQVIWRSVREVIRMPSVVRILKDVRRKRSVKFSREAIYLRDHGRCQYCGLKLAKTDVHLDHVTPRARGGKTTWENVVTSCFPCNQKKRDRLPAEAGMRLLSRPERPGSLPLMATLRDVLVASRKSIPDQWLSYLYWNVELEQDS